MAKCEFCGKDVSFGIQVSTPTGALTGLETQHQACEGNRKRFSAQGVCCTRRLRSGKVTRAV